MGNKKVLFAETKLKRCGEIRSNRCLARKVELDSLKKLSGFKGVST